MVIWIVRLHVRQSTVNDVPFLLASEAWEFYAEFAHTDRTEIYEIKLNIDKLELECWDLSTDLRPSSP